MKRFHQEHIENQNLIIEIRKLKKKVTSESAYVEQRNSTTISVPADGSFNSSIPSKAGCFAYLQMRMFVMVKTNSQCIC